MSEHEHRKCAGDLCTNSFTIIIEKIVSLSCRKL